MNANEDEFRKEGELPVASMSTLRSPILPPDKEKEINGEITLFWQNAKCVTDTRYIPITLRIYSWCGGGHRHITEYKLMVFELGKSNISTMGNICSGVSFTSRSTNSQPVWKLKLFRKFKSIPLVGKYFDYGN